MEAATAEFIGTYLGRFAGDTAVLNPEIAWNDYKYDIFRL
jgi:hypothetical protein